MALIIKGNMPSCCAVCWDCNGANDGNFCNRATGNRLGNDWQLFRPLNCPIIGEIPDEHGRLVSKDDVIYLLEQLLNRIKVEPQTDNAVNSMLRDAIELIEKNAPVVVEATT